MDLCKVGVTGTDSSNTDRTGRQILQIKPCLPFTNGQVIPPPLETISGLMVLPFLMSHPMTACSLGAKEARKMGKLIATSLQEAASGRPLRLGLGEIPHSKPVQRGC